MLKAIMIGLILMALPLLCRAQVNDSTKVIVEEQQEIYHVEKFLPTFPGCEGTADWEQKKACASQKLLEFVYSNLVYPNIARENGVEGRVVIQFVIEKDGSIKNIEIVEDIGFGCGAEALRVAHKMPHWEPGKPRGRPERCQYRMPIEFRLENGKLSKPKELKLEMEVIPLPYKEEKEVYDYVEYPPIWAGCENMTGYYEKSKCSQERSMEFIKTNLKYPKKARRKKIEGTVYVSFIIEKDGSVSNALLKSEIGEGCGAEALRLILSMPKWSPGIHQGQKIRFQKEMAVDFYLTQQK